LRNIAGLYALLGWVGLFVVGTLAAVYQVIHCAFCDVLAVCWWESLFY
jgi:hypothetical protein